MQGWIEPFLSFEPTTMANKDLPRAVRCAPLGQEFIKQSKKMINALFVVWHGIPLAKRSYQSPAGQIVPLAELEDQPLAEARQEYPICCGIISVKIGCGQGEGTI